MLDYVMLQHLPGSIYSDSIYRCPSCRQGPVMAGDGFLMNRCLNCGRYQHATDLGRCDLSWVRKQVAGAWQRFKRCFASGTNPKVENASGFNLGCELEGGMK